MDKLAITGKISFKLDSNSSLVLEYGHNSICSYWQFKFFEISLKF